MKTICIYHSIDLDGWMSAAIVKKWFEDKYKYRYQLFDLNKENSPNTWIKQKELEFLKGKENYLFMLGWNHGDDIPDLSEYDKVIMCDISFPKKEMFKLFEQLDTNFIWIDHHISAMNENCGKENIKEDVDVSTLYNGIRNAKFAACELTWKYFFPTNKMPEIVRLLGRYDCFGHKGTKEEQKVLEFQYGARQCINDYNSAYHYLDRNINFKEYYGNDNVVISNIHNDGKTIYKYLCTEAKQTYKKAFSIKFYKHITLSGAISEDKFNFLCVNQERFNPINFGIDYNKYKKLKIGDKFTVDYNDNIYTVSSIDFNFKGKGNCYYTKESNNQEYELSSTINECKPYDGFACFWYKDNKWFFSLYNDNGNVDCSKIAKEYGGGGHKGAAGFIVDNIEEFLKIHK